MILVYLRLWFRTWSYSNILANFWAFDWKQTYRLTSVAFEYKVKLLQKLIEQILMNSSLQKVYLAQSLEICSLQNVWNRYPHYKKSWPQIRFLITAFDIEIAYNSSYSFKNQYCDQSNFVFFLNRMESSAFIWGHSNFTSYQLKSFQAGGFQLVLFQFYFRNFGFSCFLIFEHRKKMSHMGYSIFIWKISDTPSWIILIQASEQNHWNFFQL